MKTRNLILGMLLVFGLAMTSCNKNDDDNNPTTGNGTLSLKYGGASWNASLAVQGVNASGVINVTGSDSNAHQASIILMGVTQPGTYQLTMGSGNQLRWTEGLDSEQTYLANGLVGSGSVTVTEISDSAIKGTFSFDGYSTSGATKSITDGQFSASF